MSKEQRTASCDSYYCMQYAVWINNINILVDDDGLSQMSHVYPIPASCHSRFLYTNDLL